MFVFTLLILHACKESYPINYIWQFLAMLAALEDCWFTTRMSKHNWIQHRRWGSVAHEVKVISHIASALQTCVQAEPLTSRLALLLTCMWITWSDQIDQILIVKQIVLQKYIQSFTVASWRNVRKSLSGPASVHHLTDTITWFGHYVKLASELEGCTSKGPPSLVQI